MKKLLYLFLTLSVIVILTLVILSNIFKDQSKSLYCSPTKPRGVDQAKWQETITPKTASLPIDQNFFNKFVVTSDDNYYLVKYPSPNLKENPFKYEIREISLDVPLEIDEGRLELYGLGIAFPDANHIGNDDVPFKFFDANFQPGIIEKEDDFWTFEKFQIASSLQRYPYLCVQICFRYQGIEDMIFNGIKFFDARTRKLLLPGFSSGGTTTNEWAYQQFTVNIPLWHYAPIDIVIDASSGPSEIFEFPPKSGEGFIYDGFECRLIDVFENIDPYRLSTSSTKGMIIHKIPKADTDTKRPRFLFACQPAATQMPVTFSFLDKYGKELYGGGSSTSDFVQSINLQQPLEKVARIRAKYRTNRYRIIIHLPYIPGLPEQNRNINDLFDVYIPYVKLYDPGQVNDFLYKTLQLSQSQRTGPIPVNSIYSIKFPIEFRGVTVRDIAKLYTTGGTLNVNMEKDQLELEYPMPFLTKMKMFLKKLLQKNRRSVLPNCL